MTLTNKRDFPPGGYLYREPSIKWKATSELALMGREAVAQALQIVRIQNPLSGLDPSYEACLDAVDAYTCARLGNDPKYCNDTSTPEVLSMATKGSSKPRQKRKCASCGKR